MSAPGLQERACRPRVAACPHAAGKIKVTITIRDEAEVIRLSTIAFSGIPSRSTASRLLLQSCEDIVKTDQITTSRLPVGLVSTSLDVQAGAQKTHTPGLETILFARDKTAQAVPDPRSRFKITEVRASELGVHLVGALLMVPFAAGGVLLAEAFPRCAPIALWQSAALVVSLVALACVHECLHGLGLMKLAHVPWKYIEIGMRWRTLTPYCHCQVPVPLHAYRRMALLPLWCLCPLLLLILVVFPAEWLGIVAGISIANCAGDVWLAAKLRRFGGAVLVQDCPSDLGCDVMNVAV